MRGGVHALIGQSRPTMCSSVTDIMNLSIFFSVCDLPTCLPATACLPQRACQRTLINCVVFKLQMTECRLAWGYFSHICPLLIISFPSLFSSSGFPCMSPRHSPSPWQWLIPHHLDVLFLINLDTFPITTCFAPFLRRISGHRSHTLFHTNQVSRARSTHTFKTWNQPVLIKSNQA